MTEHAAAGKPKAVAASRAGRSAPPFTDACLVERVPLDDGLTLVRSFCRPDKDLSEPTEQADSAPTLVITFGLTGESAFVARAGTRLRFRQGYTTLSVFSACRGERQFAGNTATRQLRLSVGQAALARYLNAPDALLPRGAGVRLLGERMSSSLSLTLARALAEPGAMSHLDAHIAALSLVGEHLRGLGPLVGHRSPSARWTPADVAKIRRAHDLMYTQMDRALTIAYLCMTVGVNEFKLKQGFREIYGTTPHRALLDMRMQRARQLLNAGAQVAQAAYAVGYAHPANFSTAFERYFGRRPKNERARAQR